MDDVKRITGFVALIDVLGFRELVGKDDGLDQVQKYIESVISILDSANPSLQFVLFSDNLVINTIDETDESFANIIRTCSHLSYQLSQQRIAVRGAIAYGTFMRSPNTRQGVILAGRPIVEANHYQHSQNWIGTILTPSVVAHFEHLDNRCKITKPKASESGIEWAKDYSFAMHLQPYREIPFHKTSTYDNGNFDGYVVVPVNPNVRNWGMYTLSHSNLAHQLGIMKLAAPDPLSQEKYARTLDWLGYLRKTVM